MPGLRSKARRDMVESAGRVFQLLGLPRSTGQIYGLLYLSDKPLSLGDMVELLELSKGSASGATRHLVSLGAIRQVWVPGDRRDYFESVGDISLVIRSIYQEFFRPRMSASAKRLSTIMADLASDRQEGVLTPAEADFCEQRIHSLVKLQKRVDQLAPLAEKLLI